MARSATVRRSIDPLTSPIMLGRDIEPRVAAVLLRPFGYLLVSVVWVVLFLVCVATAVVALPAALSGTVGDAGLGASPAFHRSDTWMAFIVIPLVMAVLGCVGYLLILASLGNMLAALTLFARSLRPSFRHERLSASIRAAGGEAVGPATTAVTGVSLSLLPMRLTRWTKFVMIVQFNGWVINGPMFSIGSVWGALYVFTVGWVLWPATGVGLVVCGVVSAALAGILLWMIWQRRSVFPTVMPGALENSPYRWSWPNKPPVTKKRDRRTMPSS
ncbi:hypothetical protein SAMN04515691_3230 [Leifsonia sp. 98AMF]|uniref:hypothetical protein n=1 Tax=unclassified Leifsonia TaxID=2663824 RepID=UPI00087BA263|nr:MULTISPECIES: hypothetical protein [unclassified Leifsonia]SDH11392.1 hypothetical protein SAMN04515690_0786 [Leifsonia sp. 197AMF]SDJ27343.1 hypothetical protein SAMN04515684_2996 [Leifsonia sp. 466MF]SDK54066.1 hypothetical protein SAMN04515683_3768 [Leifsonia sp. 157MF]SDN49369.1 hypothetical protein SAMN04515686_1181 [Leifsonia sp. 509MF]SEN61193.1 hypothetical protein SAMN04515685_3750 [Leifsonia sp. 467MF]